MESNLADYASQDEYKPGYKGIKLLVSYDDIMFTTKGTRPRNVLIAELVICFSLRMAMPVKLRTSIVQVHKPNLSPLCLLASPSQCIRNSAR